MAKKKVTKKSKKKVITKSKKKVLKKSKKKVIKKSKKKVIKKSKKRDLLSSPINEIGLYKIKRGEAYMCKAQLNYFKSLLMKWKNDLIEEVDRTVIHMKDEASNFPDPNDRATQESEFGLELRTRDRERKLLKKINSALTRIEEGDYGYCDETGEEIGLKRLQARPVATLTLEAQERREKAERQYRDSDDRYR